MHEAQPRRGSSTLRRVAFAGLAIAALAWLSSERRLAPEVWHQLRAAERGWLVVMFVATGLGMVNLAMFHAAAQRAAGLTTRRLELVEAAATANSLNMVTKSGGFAGLAPITAQARRAGRPAGTVLAAYALVVLVGQWTFAVVLAVAASVLWDSGHLTTAEVVAIAVFGALVGAQVLVLVAAARRSPRLDRVVSAPRRWWGRLRHEEVEPTSARLDEVHASLGLLRRDPRRCLPVLAHGFGVEACAVAQLTAAIAATGQGVHVVVALLAYSTGVLFAIVGFLPGGIGVVEVSTATVLVTSGIGVVPAAAAVVLFRVAEMWLPVALGALAALRQRHHRTAAT